ncbi:hypothetical protein WMF45_13145 [Sorangium sp. So ce448]|uniref:hypothetical protein n=1 Tax=Sorangium sp. So ce448 TaxID=3133314 RepID=UPI003F5F8914
MKSSAAEQRHHEVVVAVAKEYEGKGYDVTVEPLPDHLPGFLRPYRPDILVRKGEENYVIEVALPGAHRGDRHLWPALAEKVSREPGWHLKVVVADVEAGEAPRLHALPTADDVRAQLKVAQSLLEQGSVAASLLFAWSLFEAAARLRMLGDGRDPAKPATPASLITSLVYFGHIEQHEADSLRDVMRVRNGVAHGYLGIGAPVPEDKVRLLLDVVRRLLSDESGDDSSASPLA